METFPTLAGAKAVADPAKRQRRAAVFMIRIMVISQSGLETNSIWDYIDYNAHNSEEKGPKKGKVEKIVLILVWYCPDTSTITVYLLAHCTSHASQYSTIQQRTLATVV